MRVEGREVRERSKRREGGVRVGVERGEEGKSREGSEGRSRVGEVRGKSREGSERVGVERGEGGLE